MTARPGGAFVAVDKGVPNYIAEALVSAVANLHRLTAVNHRLLVHVVPHPTVGSEDGIGFAAFECPHAAPAGYRKIVKIHVGAGFARILRRHGDSRDDAVRGVLHNLMHEVAHYEQWRDGGLCSERGVNVRAHNMLVSLARLCAAQRRNHEHPLDPPINS